MSFPPASLQAARQAVMHLSDQLRWALDTVPMVGYAETKRGSLLDFIQDLDATTAYNPAAEGMASTMPVGVVSGWETDPAPVRLTDGESPVFDSAGAASSILVLDLPGMDRAAVGRLKPRPDQSDPRRRIPTTIGVGKPGGKGSRLLIPLDSPLGAEDHKRLWERERRLLEDEGVKVGPYETIVRLSTPGEDAWIIVRPGEALLNSQFALMELRDQDRSKESA